MNLYIRCITDIKINNNVFFISFNIRDYELIRKIYS
jgi:hypothetical protein